MALFLFVAVMSSVWTSWLWAALFGLGSARHWYLYVNRSRQARQRIAEAAERQGVHSEAES